MPIKRMFCLLVFPLLFQTSSAHPSSLEQTIAQGAGSDVSPDPQEPTDQQPRHLRLLVVDYAMAYPEENTRVIRAFSEAGFHVDYRPYYPALVKQDAGVYDVILLLGGAGPGMSIEEVNLAINFVARGKVLVLAMPSNGPYGDRRKVNPGVHDRYQFNEVMSRLNINLHALNADHALSPVLNPVVLFEPAADHPVSQTLEGAVAARAGTRLLVGAGTIPLLLEPERAETEKEPEEPLAPEAEPEYRLVRRTLRIQPENTIAGEEVELLLRGVRELRTSLYYRNRAAPAPVDWSTSRFKGRVEGVTDSKDTLTVRMPGNRWGAEHALVTVPVGVIAAAFADREIREEIQSATDLASMRDDPEAFGRMAVVAAGRTDRLSKGFVLAIDRQTLTGLDRPLAPLGMGPPISAFDRLETFLRETARYVHALTDSPGAWSPDHDYPAVTMPGNRKPDITLNDVSILTALPERVRVINSLASGPSLDSGTEPGSRSNTIPDPETKTDAGVSYDPADDVSHRGVWDFIARHHEQVADLAELLPGLGMDFLWTVAPAASYVGGASAPADLRFEAWTLPIMNRLAGTPTAWYAGVSAPREGEISGDFVDAVDARGDPVGLPSRLDMAYQSNHLFKPARAIARHSSSHAFPNAIVHDWEPHINRPLEAYAATDIFDDLHFRYFVRHLARNGLYQGDEFKSLLGLGRDNRFEWLLKSGYLETYIQLQEYNAERLGTLYRQSIDAIDARLRHGAFVRSLRPDWFRLGFWRGAGTPTRPFLVFSYERPPEWYAGFLRARGVYARVIPVGLLGLLDQENLEGHLRSAADQGGYTLERGIWLLADPTEETILNAPRKDLTREALLETIRKVGH